MGYALQLSEEELYRYRLMAEAARESENELWDLAGIAPGAAIADVGCGPGAMFPALVDAVEADGSLVGVDGEPSTVDQARALVDTSGWPNVTVQVGKADATGLPANSFDVVMMRHVLAHNGQREQAIVDHLATLLKPGGRLYLVDVDVDGFRIRPDDPQLAELSAAYARFHAAQGNDLKTGLRLDELLRSADMEIVAYRGWYQIVRPQGELRPPAWAARDAMLAAGVVTADDLARWESALKRITAQGAVTVFAPVFGAIGRRG
ncbi:MAG TPA: methyltransferase domain-containing protein [Jatrophihabitans sp.]|nr:methyltransferase domain-containing protein [Jatrophihabitans sp.]